MKNFLLLLILASLVGCNEKNLSPEDIQPMLGPWRLEAVEHAQEVKSWEIVPLENTYYFKIRYDGVILDANGLPACCAPKYLNINQKRFTIEPEETLPSNPQCAVLLGSA